MEENIDWFEALSAENDNSGSDSEIVNSSVRDAQTSVKTSYWGCFMNSIILENYISMLVEMSMLPHIKYCRLINNLMICHVTNPACPNGEVIVNNNMTTSRWRPLSRYEQQLAHVRNRQGKLRYIIEHTDEYPVFMFIFDCEAQRHRDEEEHYRLIEGSRKRLAPTPEPPVLIKKPNTSTIATQTDQFERLDYVNRRPANFIKSLIGRETNGHMNRTNVVIGFRNTNKRKFDQLRLKVHDLFRRFTPTDNMIALSRIYNGNTQIFPFAERPELYNRCRYCTYLFLTETLNTVCFQCATEHNVTLIPETRRIRNGDTYIQLPRGLDAEYILLPSHPNLY